MVRITLLAFAQARDLFPEKRDLDVPPATSIGELLDRIQPTWRAKLPTLRVAVNQSFVSLEHVLQNGEIVALIPPVSGG